MRIGTRHDTLFRGRSCPAENIRESRIHSVSSTCNRRLVAQTIVQWNKLLHVMNYINACYTYVYLKSYDAP